MALVQEAQYQIRTFPSSDILVLATCLHLFDESVEWLTSRGLSSQWGTKPMKNDAAHIEKLEKMIEVGPRVPYMTSKACSFACFVHDLSRIFCSSVRSSSPLPQKGRGGAVSRRFSASAYTRYRTVVILRSFHRRRKPRSTSKPSSRRALALRPRGWEQLLWPKSIGLVEKKRLD